MATPKAIVGATIGAALTAAAAYGLNTQILNKDFMPFEAMTLHPKAVSCGGNIGIEPLRVAWIDTECAAGLQEPVITASAKGIINTQGCAANRNEEIHPAGVCYLSLK